MMMMVMMVMMMMMICLCFFAAVGFAGFALVFCFSSGAALGVEGVWPLITPYGGPEKIARAEGVLTKR